MEPKNYLLIDTTENICTNSVLWDGDTSQWEPPAGVIAVDRDLTPAKVWQLGPDSSTWVLVEQAGRGDIGFTWDGQYLTTNEPQPVPVVQPTVTGAQTL